MSLHPLLFNRRLGKSMNRGRVGGVLVCVLVVGLLGKRAASDEPLSWVNVIPAPRSWHSMEYDINHEQVMILGGVLSTGFGSDIWAWEGARWTQIESMNVSPVRFGFATACETEQRRIILFGGYGGNSVPYPHVLGDTWEWDGTTWIQKNITGPEPREFHAMAYDSIRKRVVLFGGDKRGSNFLGDTWEWDGVAWSQVATTGPSPRSSHKMVYDAAREKIVLFGGQGPNGPRFGDMAMGRNLMEPSRDNRAFSTIRSCNDV
jgi:hypothetical protein